MRIILTRVLVVATLLVFSCALSRAQTLTAKDYLTRGYAHLDACELDAALADADKVVELKPDHASGYILRITVWNRKEPKNYRSADVDRIINLAPDDPKTGWVYVIRAIHHLGQSNWSSAVDDLNKAIPMDPRAELYSFRSYAYLELGNLDESRADYGRSHSLDATQPSPFIRRGYAHFRKQNFSEAYAAFTGALDWEQDYASAYAGRGLALGMQGDLDAAVKEFTKALGQKAFSLSPDTCPVMCNCAARELSEFIEKNPTNARAYEVRGVIALLLEKPKWATSDFTRAIRYDPGLAPEIQRLETQLRRH